MSKSFLNSIEDLISVIDSDLPEIVLNILGKSDLEHAYIVAYAITTGKGVDGLEKAVEGNLKSSPCDRARVRCKAHGAKGKARSAS